MTRDHAEAVGLAALAFILADAAQAGRFLALTGLRPADLRAAVRDPATLGAALDFLLEEDDRVIRFCDGEGLAYELPARARRALPGAAPPD